MEVDTEELQELADYAEEQGFLTKARNLRRLADDIELHSSPISALEEARDGDLEETRDAIQSRIIALDEK